MEKRYLSDLDLFFSLNRLPICSKLALLSAVTLSLPKFLLTLCFLFSEIQTFSIFINTAFFNTISNKSGWPKIFDSLHYISSIGGAISYHSSPLLTSVFQIIVCMYIYSLLILSIYLLVMLKRQKTPNSFSQAIWRLFCYIHPYVLFYPIHFTLVKISSEVLGNWTSISTIEPAELVLQVFSGIAIGLNLFYCFGVIIFFKLYVKNADPLSTKTNILNILNIALKTLYPLIWLFYPHEANILILTSVNIIYTVLRDSVHFYQLPYYNFSTLKLATGLYSLSSLYALSAFLSAFVGSFIDLQDLTVSLILWVICSPLFMKLYLNFLNKLTISILLKPSNTLNPYHILHRWYICKSFAKYSAKPAEADDFRGYQKKHLIYQSHLEQLQKENNDQLESSPCKLFLPSLMIGSLQSQSMAKSYTLIKEIERLRGAVRLHPRNSLLKINLIRLEIKTKQIHLTVDRQIQESLKSTLSFSLKNSFCMMRLKILQKLRAAHWEGDKKTGKQAYLEFMDMYDYVNTNEMLDVLKQKLRAQLRSQMKFCNEFKLQTVQLHSLTDLSKQIHTQAELVQSYWHYFQRTTDIKIADPYLILGSFASLVLEDDVMARDFFKRYYEYKLRDKIGDLQDDMGSTNRAMKNAVWLAISGHPKEIGKILRCSNRINILDIKKDTVMGKSISLLIPTFFRVRHDTHMKIETHSRTLGIMNKIREVYILNGQSYLILCHICVMLSFIPGIGLCYFSLLEPVNKTRRSVLLNEEGVMQNCSKNFAEDLNIMWDSYKKGLDLFLACPKLRKLVKKLLFEKSKGVAKTAVPDSLEKTLRENDLNLTGIGSPEGMISNVKLQFLPFPKNYEAPFSVKLANKDNKDSLDKVLYNVTIKLHRREHGNMIEMVMDRLDLQWMVQEMPVTSNNIPIRLSKLKTKTPKATAQSLLTSNDEPIIKKEKSPRTPRREEEVAGVSNFNSGGKREEERRRNKKSLRDLGASPLSKQNDELQLEEDPLFNGKATYATTIIQTKREGTLLQNENFQDSLSSQRFGLGPRRIEYTFDSIKVQGDNQRLASQEGDKWEFGELQEAHTGLAVNSSPDPVREQQLESSFQSFSFKRPVSLRDGKGMNMSQGKEEPDSGQISLSGSSSRNERAKKVIRNVLQLRKMRKSSVVYIIIFALTMLITFGVMLWLSLHAPIVWNNVQIISKVLQTLQLRTFATDLVNQEVRLGAAMNTIANDLSVFPKTLVGVIGPDGTIPNSMKILNKYNNQLKTAVVEANNDIQRLFYERNVRILHRSEDGTLVSDLDKSNTFQVLDQIISNGFYVASLPYPPAPLPELPRGFRFIFDNSVNDLLIVVERLSDVLFGMIEDLCETGKNTGIVVLTVSLVILMIFLLISLNFIIRINLGFFQFMNVLMTVSVVDMEKARERMSKLDSLLSKEYDENNYIKVLQTYETVTQAKNPQAKNYESTAKNSLRKGSIKGIYRQNFLMFIQEFVVILLVVVCLVLYYIHSNTSINTIHLKQLHMNTALLNINQQSLISVQLQGMILDNDTTPIRNLPIDISLDQSIQKLKTVEQLQRSLQDTDGQLSETFKNILYHYDCSKLATTLFDHLNSAALNRKCLEITNGRDNVELSSLLPMMATQLEDLNAQFHDLNGGTESMIRSLYIKALSIFLSEIDVSVALFAISYDETALTVQNDLEELHRDNILMAGMSVVISVAMAFFIWFLIVNRMVRRQFDIKKTLSLVPTHLILDNLHLKRYLIMISKHESKEVQFIGRF